MFRSSTRIFARPSTVYQRSVGRVSLGSRSYSSSNRLPSSTWLRYLAGASGAALTLGFAQWLLPDYAHACGIIGFVGEESATPYLLEGITILQNRGYDSAGIATIRHKGEQGVILVSKFASVGSTSDSIELLREHAPAVHKDDAVGIAHTRWATHGGKTDENAHPHMDHKDRIALVHNGTIENSNQLKKEMQAMGITFRSQTDTEVIANLIGYYLDSGMDVMEATKKVLGRLEGTWGLAIIHRDHPNQIIAARNGSPIVIGIGTNKRMFVASEVAAFSRHTNSYISLKDGEVAVVNAENMSLDMNRIEKAPEEHIELSPAPYPHWTIKEIMEQPEAIARTLNYGARFAADGGVKLGGLESNKDLLLNIHHLMMSACGTSFFAALYGATMFRSLKCFDTVNVIEAPEINIESLPSQAGGMLVLSQSGETKDTHRALVAAETSGLPVFSVINQVGSLIARSTNCGVYLNAGREHAVASTKAFTTQVTALALIAAWYAQNRHKNDSNMSQRRNELVESIHRLPIYTGMTLQTLHPRIRELATRLHNTPSSTSQRAQPEHMFILGKGFGEAIAREGALKIKEITYAHAEGYSGGALKHGPFALLDEQTPVVHIIIDDQHAEMMRIAAQEVHARGAHNIIITDKPALAEGICKPEDLIVIPSNGPMTALLAVIPLQLLAYEMALLRGINPDKPRHLAKAVTVD